MTAAYGELAYGELEYSAPLPPTPHEVYDVELPVVALIYSAYDAELPIQINIEPAGYDVVLGIRAELFNAYDVELPVEAQIYSAASDAWRPVVMLGGVDVSASIVGLINIKMAEGKSATAYFWLLPDDGVVPLLAWVKSPVTIDRKDGIFRTREFTGEVVTPNYDISSGLVRMECSSDLQSKMERSTREQIDAITPGALWSDDVTQDTGDGWQYAQDRMKTLPGALWTDSYGTVCYTPWAAKTTPDVILQAADILPGSFNIDSASARSMINRVRIEMDYRYFNLRQREVHFHLGLPMTWCEFLRKNIKLPEKDQIRSAAESTNWTVQRIAYYDPPQTRVFVCDGESRGWILTPYAKTTCTGAVITMSKRWAQEVSENFILDVRADDSITAIGEMGVQEVCNVESDYDYDEWEQNDDYEGIKSGSSLHAGGSGDYSIEADEERRAEMELSQRVRLARASAEIIGTHRLTEVTFYTPIIPSLDLSHTVEVNHPKIDVRAKIVSLEKVLDASNGVALNKITLGVSRHEGVGGGSASPLDAPDRPQPTQETPFQKSIRLDFRIGPGPIGNSSLGGVELGEDEFNGYSINDRSVKNPALVDYPEGMTINTPVIEAAAVDAVVLQAPQTYQVVIPQDLFIVRK